MTEYVAGFMFEDGNVALIKKLRPSWQAGRLNGIGGNVEPGESPGAAIVREFEEETGVHTSLTQWWPFAVLTGEDFAVHFFSSYGKLDELDTLTDEEVMVVPISEVTVENSIPNLTWLIPMAKSINFDRTHTFHIREEY